MDTGDGDKFNFNSKKIIAFMGECKLLSIDDDTDHLDYVGDDKKKVFSLEMDDGKK